MSDDEIVKAFVKGARTTGALGAPTEGFNLLAWIMPWIMVSLGLVAIWLFISRLHP